MEKLEKNKLLLEVLKGVTERLVPVSLAGFLFFIDSPWEKQGAFVVAMHVALAALCLYHDHVEEVRERNNSLWKG